MVPKSHPGLTVRLATPEDSAVCGEICFRAFSKINGAHNFPCDFPGPEASTGLLSMLFSTDRKSVV